MKSVKGISVEWNEIRASLWEGNCPKAIRFEELDYLEASIFYGTTECYGNEAANSGKTKPFTLLHNVVRLIGDPIPPNQLDQFVKDNPVSFESGIVHIVSSSIQDDPDDIVTSYLRYAFDAVMHSGNVEFNDSVCISYPDAFSESQRAVLREIASETLMREVKTYPASVASCMNLYTPTEELQTVLVVDLDHASIAFSIVDVSKCSGYSLRSSESIPVGGGVFIDDFLSLLPACALPKHILRLKALKAINQLAVEERILPDIPPFIEVSRSAFAAVCEAHLSQFRASFLSLWNSVDKPALSHPPLLRGAFRSCSLLVDLLLHTLNLSEAFPLDDTCASFGLVRFSRPVAPIAEVAPQVVFPSLSATSEAIPHWAYPQLSTENAPQTMTRETMPRVSPRPRPVVGRVEESVSGDLSPVEMPLARLRESHLRRQRQYERERLERQQSDAGAYPAPPDSHSPIPSTVPAWDQAMTERQRSSLRLLSVEALRGGFDTRPPAREPSPFSRFSFRNRVERSTQRMGGAASGNASPDPIVPPPPMVNRETLVSPSSSNPFSPSTITSSLSKLSPEVATNPPSLSNPWKGKKGWLCLFSQTCSHKQSH